MIMKNKKQELLNKINDGRWMIELLPLYKRVDWKNVHRKRTIELFGKKFYNEKMADLMYME
ncbi:MAG: hypothetical protein AB1765_09025 [Candidatus Hydrogenedentota bacterium]